MRHQPLSEERTNVVPDLFGNGVHVGIADNGSEILQYLSWPFDAPFAMYAHMRQELVLVIRAVDMQVPAVPVSRLVTF